MFPAAMRVLPIKDLKDLSVFFRRGDYRHAGPKGPEEVFSRQRSRGTGPRATVDEAASRLTRSGAGTPELRSLAPILLILKIL